MLRGPREWGRIKSGLRRPGKARQSWPFMIICVAEAEKKTQQIMSSSPSQMGLIVFGLGLIIFHGVSPRDPLMANCYKISVYVWQISKENIKKFDI